MTTAELRQRQTGPPRQPFAVELVAVLFFFLSLGLFGVLVVWAVIAELFVSIGGLTPGQVVWQFISTLGIIRPVLLLLGAGLLLRLSVSLRGGQLGAIRWARLICYWLVGVTGAATAYVVVQSLATGQNAQDVFLGSLPYVLALVVSVLLQRAVALSLPHFTGDEDITSKRTRSAWNLLMPTLIVLIVIAITPLERVFITSLTDERFASSDPINFVGMENYTQLWSVRLDVIDCDDPAVECELLINGDGTQEVVYPRLRNLFRDTGREPEYNELRYRDFASFTLDGRQFVFSARDIEFVQSLFTSIYYTVLATFFQFTIGFAIAMILAQRLRGIGFLRLVMLIPMTMPTLIATQFWEVMLRPDETGLFNALLVGGGALEQSQQWLLNPALQVPTLVAVIVWKEAPIVALLLLPGLLAIPRETYQAAAIDGANRLQRFWYITLPMMRPTIGVALVLRTMIFLRVFDLFEILLGRTRYVMSTYAYDTLIQRQQLGYSSAVSVTIFIITMAFTIAYMRTLRIDEA